MSNLVDSVGTLISIAESTQNSALKAICNGLDSYSKNNIQKAIDCLSNGNFTFVF